MAKEDRHLAVAVLTGATGGLGFAIATELGRSGYRLYLTCEPQDPRFEEASRELAGVGVPIDWEELNLDDLEAVDKYGRRLLAREHEVDVLVNCAGILHRGNLEETAAADMMHSFAVNCVAPYVLTRALMPALEVARGSVVNVASITAVVAARNRVAYAASKAGLAAVTRALAIDLAPSIRVNAVLPGVFSTSMNAALVGDSGLLQRTVDRIPSGRLGEPDDLASVVAFLAGGDSGYVTGVSLAVDGGVTARSALPAGDR